MNDIIKRRNVKPAISTAEHTHDMLIQAFRQFQAGNDWLVPDAGDKNHISRLHLYADWMDASQRHWTQPALVDYADYLLSDERQRRDTHTGELVAAPALVPVSVNSHLSTIRARYRSLVNRPGFKQRLRAFADEAFSTMALADRRVLIMNLLEDIQDAINPELTKVKTPTQQDRIDSDHVRLTRQQAESLYAAPGMDSLRGLRDTALLGFLLCTGLREAELVGLDVNDLRQTVNDNLGVYVHEGKGAKSRFVPYGELDWILAYVDAWLARAGIAQGAVFRGFEDRHLTDTLPGDLSPVQVYPRLTPRLTTRAVQDILRAYPVTVNGELRSVKPHDTRRTYAKLLYDSGVDMLAIRDNLGHADIKTTQGYIGDLEMDKRRAPAMLTPQHDMKALERLQRDKKLL